MPGFDAIGRLALGQGADQAAATVVLVAVSGAFAVAAPSVAWQIFQPSSASSCALAANNATFRAALAGVAGNYAFAGNGATLRSGLSAGAASYAVANVPAAFAANVPASGGAVVWTGRVAPLGTSLLSATVSFAVTGYQLDFTRDFEAWFPRPFDAQNWIASAIAGAAWAPGAISSDAWTAKPQQAETWTPAAIQTNSWTTE